MPDTLFNSVENATNYTSNATTAVCLRMEIPDDEYAVAYRFFSLLAIVINVLTCPCIILLNALVIASVKTKRRLQTNYNLLLAALAGTDLVVVIAAQPLFIAQEVYLQIGGSPLVFCTIYRITQVATICLCLVSLFHLVLISVERFVAMKYALRYESIVNKFRLSIAVVCSWIIATEYGISILVPAIPVIPAHIFVVLSLLAITYCHVTVFFVCRRHLLSIKSEQVSEEANEKFQTERKTWKQPVSLLVVSFCVIRLEC